MSSVPLLNHKNGDLSTHDAGLYGLARDNDSMSGLRYDQETPFNKYRSFFYFPVAAARATQSDLDPLISRSQSG